MAKKSQSKVEADLKTAEEMQQQVVDATIPTENTGVNEADPAQMPEEDLLSRSEGKTAEEVDATEDNLREFRVLLDSHLRGMEQLKYEHREHEHAGSVTLKGAQISSQVEHAILSISFAKAWIGKVLEARNYKSSYGSNYQTVQDIQPTADRAQDDLILTESRPSYVGQITDLRNRLDFDLELFRKLEPNRPEGKYEARAWTNAYMHLSEAKMHLGFEYQRIREIIS